jgi:transcriptional regulator GlxA family with amidase domain
MLIEVVVYDGFDEMDAVGPYEVLRNAADAGAPFEVELVGADGPGAVRGSHGTVVQVATGLGEPDAVVVPGGGWNDRGSPGAWSQACDGRLTGRLVDLAPRLRWIASVCTGGMLLAESGLLRGRPAVTHRSAMDQLARYGAEPVDARVVDDGAVLTAGGVTSGLDLALWLVEREAGPEVAAQVEREIEHARLGPIVFGPSSPFRAAAGTR